MGAKRGKTESCQAVRYHRGVLPVGTEEMRTPPDFRILCPNRFRPWKPCGRYLPLEHGSAEGRSKEAIFVPLKREMLLKYSSGDNVSSRLRRVPERAPDLPV